MRILFISRYFPNDLRTCTYGTFQRMRMLIDAIKEIAHLDILFYVSPDIDISPEAIAAKAQELSEHWHVSVDLSLCHLYGHPDSMPKWQRHLHGVFNFSKQLLFFGTSGSEQVKAFEQCLERKPDLIFGHRLGAIAPALLTSQPLPPIILDLDDIEHINFLRTLKQLPKQLELWMYGLQIPALWWGELQGIRLATVTFVCSERDRFYLTNKWRLPGVQVIPNTVNIPKVQPMTTEPTLLFLASYQYQPNLQAANFLLEKIWPYIYRIMPEAKLIIAGREEQNIGSYSKNLPGVEFTGFVEDLDALYRRTRVVCCPILSGGGTRIKMIEAAAYGKAIVSTSVGAEGLRMSNEKDFLLRNNPKKFALACLELLNNNKLCKEIGAAARSAACLHYDQTQILESIQKHIVKLNQTKNKYR
jgi:glycosyltransferase involved in cell wall biosynthesis